MTLLLGTTIRMWKTRLQDGFTKAAVSAERHCFLVVLQRWLNTNVCSVYTNWVSGTLGSLSAVSVWHSWPPSTLLYSKLVNQGRLRPKYLFVDEARAVQCHCRTGVSHPVSSVSHLKQFTKPHSKSNVVGKCLFYLADVKSSYARATKQKNWWKNFMLRDEHRCIASGIWSCCWWLMLTSP